jgi:hypothetical protein
MAVVNTLAYYATATIAAVKSIVVQAPTIILADSNALVLVVKFSIELGTAMCST